MANNIYGVEKVEEPEVRDGLDIASNTALGTAQAAKIGHKVGGGNPWVTGAFAAAGLTKSLYDQQKLKREEERQLSHAKDTNAFVTNLEGRALREENVVSAQARYGMRPNNKYETAEIEGDGSGDSDGIGEIHVDKNYNIKNIARGGKKHEQGGFKINNLEKEDTIFPTQNNEKEFNRVLSAINRWKLKGDRRSKEYLDGKRDSLPTDEDYGYDTNKAYSNGKRRDQRNKNRNRRRFEKVYPEIDYDWWLEVTNQGQDDVPGGDIESAWNADKEQWEQNRFTNTELERQRRIAEQDTRDFYAANPNQEFQDQFDLDGDVDLDESEMAYVTEDEGIQVPEGQFLNPETGEFEDIPAKGVDPSVIGAPNIKKKIETVEEIDNKISPQDEGDGINENEALGINPYVPGAPNIKKAAKEVKRKEFDKIKPLTEAEKKRLEQEARDREAQETWDEITKMEEYNSPMKYSSAFNKMATASKPIEGVQKRFITPNKYVYKDLSDKDRQKIDESRNFQNLLMRGKSLTAPQIQSYGSQNVRDAYSRHEDINAREAKRRFDIENKNVDLENQANEKNIALANQYDTIKRKQKAVKQRYKDTAVSDFAKLAQLEEQQKYMMNKDRKMFLRDKATLPFLGSRNMSVTPSGIRYIQPSDFKTKTIIGEDGNEYTVYE